ncbi:MAG TPA: tetratricopeptide repeat protein [Burkholderiales bacterium]|nr:tetratricopeptide repeat protein [Burkholderiales bacterium]
MYDLQEQEQIDALKAWWKENRRAVIFTVIAAVAGATGVQAWRYNQQTKAQEAAGLYSALQQLVPQNNTKKIHEAAAFIIEKFSSTPYAPRAALIAAKADYQAADMQGAKAQLQWVIDHAAEDELKDIARLRLAAMLLDEKNYTQALQLLEGKHSPAYDVFFSDLKGDVLVAQGKPFEARSAYQAALSQIDKKSAYRQLIQIKLEALGGK